MHVLTHFRDAARLESFYSLCGCHVLVTAIGIVFEEGKELSAHTLVLARFKPAGAERHGASQTFVSATTRAVLLGKLKRRGQ